MTGTADNVRNDARLPSEGQAFPFRGSAGRREAAAPNSWLISVDDMERLPTALLGLSVMEKAILGKPSEKIADALRT